MNSEANKQLPLAQATSLELLDFFVGISEKYNFKYVLGKETAMGLQMHKGFMPWAASISIILLYDQLVEFINVCEHELKGTPYYLITHHNTEQFDDYFIRLAKRSRVKLGVGREKDEKYYDYYVDIIPGFYAGNTRNECRKIRRVYKKYEKILNSHLLSPGSLKTGRRIIRKLISAYYHKKKRPDDYERVLSTLQKHDKPTKYIFIPSNSKDEGSIIQTRQITERKLYEFEGNQYYSFFDIEEYLIKLYGRKYKVKYYEQPINRAILEGPEILRRIQLIELDMLIEFDRICRKHNIKYTIGAGTLLGAVRHKGFIPWDDDIDVFMLYEEYKTFLNVAEKELDCEKYFLRTQETDVDNNLTFTTIKRNGTKYIKGGREKYNTHPGVPIDIFPLFNAPSTRIGHWLQDRVCKFFKTMTWAHMGAESEGNSIKRQYYRLLAQVSNKKSYGLFMKYATKVKKPSKRVAFFEIKRNFTENPVTKRELYEELTEIEFEGYMFYVTKYWADYLEYTFSKDYSRYPPMTGRKPKHMPAIVEIHDIFSNL
jgi:lipopolysaccharide cholinephosphotransferase